MTTNFPEFTVALKMARKTGPLHSDVEHRTFTVHGPAADAERAVEIAYGLGQGINEATQHAWKFCGDDETITVQPAAVEQTDLDRLRAQVADLADKLHKAETQVHSLEKATTAYANENEQLKDRISDLESARVYAACSADLLRGHLDKQKPVIDAAKAWADALTGPVEPLPHSEALYRAVQDLPKPTHWPSIYGGCEDDCPVCKTEKAEVA